MQDRAFTVGALIGGALGALAVALLRVPRRTTAPKQALIALGQPTATDYSEAQRMLAELATPLTKLQTPESGSVV